MMSDYEQKLAARLRDYGIRYNHLPLALDAADTIERLTRERDEARAERDAFRKERQS